MKCHVAHHTIHAYIEGQLPPDTLEEMRRHLAVCQKCRTEYAKQSMLSELLQDSACRQQVPLGFTDTVFNAVRDQAGAKLQKGNQTFFWKSGWTAFAGAIILAGFFTLSYMRTIPEKEMNIAARVADSKVISKVIPQPKSASKTLQTAEISNKIVRDYKTFKSQKHSRISYSRIQYAKYSYSQKRYKTARIPIAKQKIFFNSPVKPTLQNASVEDYRRVAESLRTTQQMHAEASTQVQSELNNTAMLLGQAFQSFEKAMQQPAVQSNSAQTNGKAG